MMISLNNVSKSFGDKVIFEDFSYDFGDRGVVCIKGVSGKGKTTLFKIISGLEKADKGDIIVNGTLSFLFQEDRLLPWLSAEENVACVIKGKYNERINKARELLCSFGLKGSEAQSISALSGGMKRRVAFARAIIVNPDILLLDEPFNGLDDDTKDILIDYVKKYSENHLVLLITHDQKDIDALADSIITL